MSVTITVRTDEELREALEERAESLGSSLSAVVRDILRDALTPRSMRERAGHLAGSVEIRPGDSEPWREAIRARNRRS